MGGDDENKEEADPLEEDGELKPHCMGHHFHWSEIFFAVMIAVGGGIFVVGSAGISIPTIIVNLLFGVPAGIGTMLVWNLVSIKRVAAATEMLRKDCKQFKAENDRARGMQDTLKEQDEMMKSTLADLEKAELLLKGSVDGLSGIKEQEEQMLEERNELMGQRRVVAAKLLENMKNLWRLTIEQAQEELHKRAIMLFDELSKEIGGEEQIVVGSDNWNILVDVLKNYGVDVDENSSGERSLKTLAGGDLQLSYEEFMDWLDNRLDEHFINLSGALHRNEELRAEIKNHKHEKRKRKTVANMSRMTISHAPIQV